MTDQSKPKDPSPSLSSSEPLVRRARTPLFAGALVAVVLCGGGLLLAQNEQTSIATPLQPTSISALTDSDAIALKGQVAEAFGNKFVVEDKTGRALVDTGPEGEGRQLLKTGDTIEVDGRFLNGVMHASVLLYGDGHKVVVGPLGAPPSPLARAKEHLGIWPKPDLDGLTALVKSAGYSDVRITGRGPRHLDIVAKATDGKDHTLHVDFDGRVRETAPL